MVRKKFDFNVVQQASQDVPPVELASIPQTQVRNIQLKDNLHIASKKNTYLISVNPFRN